MPTKTENGEAAAVELFPSTTSPNFATLKVRTEYGDVILHIDGNAGTNDCDALLSLLTYTIDSLRELEGPGYVIPLPAMGTGAAQAQAASGILCGLCGSGNTADQRATKSNPRAPDMRCNDCQAVVWPNKPGVWVAGKPRQ